MTTTTSRPADFGVNPRANPESFAAPIHTRTVHSEPWSVVGGQWGAIAGGAFAGLAVGIAMATLGGALGLTASAMFADRASESAVSTEGAKAAAAGFGIGAGIWLLVSAAVVGLVGGSVLAALSHPHRTYTPRAHGLVTWAFGLTVAVLLAAVGASGLAAGLGAGAAGAAGVAASPGIVRSLETGSPGSATEGRDTGARPVEASLTAVERQEAIEAAQAAATAATTAAWFALVAQLVGLGATLLGASRRKRQVGAGDLVLQPA